MSDFLTMQPVVDFVELTPRLLFLTKWARGVTQTADWQQTPLTTLGLDGRGQVRTTLVLAPRTLGSALFSQTHSFINR